MNTRRYRDVREAVLQALEARTYLHDLRTEPAKNMLEAKLVTEAFVIDMVLACPARRAKRSEHHYIPGVDVWTLTPTVRNNLGQTETWYIKLYWLKGVWFISVHPAES
jgi:hypothetical protein